MAQEGMGGLFVSLLVALQIQARGACPGAADVERHLAPLLPPGLKVTASDTATLEENGDGTLLLSLLRSDGGATIYRILPATPTCDDRAEMVAVTLAAWEAQVHTNLSLRLDRLSTAAPAQPVAPPPERGPYLSRAAGEVSRPGNNQLALGAGLVGAWQPDSIAPGARVDAMLNRRDSPWRGRLSAGGWGEHQVSVPPGYGDWSRLYLALGADYSVRLGRQWAATAGAAGVVGAFTIAGSGFAANRRAWSADVGGEVLLRVELRRWARVRPWLGLALVTWLRRQTVAVDGETTSLSLPRTEPLAALGTDFLWGP